LEISTEEKREIMADTLNWMFQMSVEKFGDSPALSSKVAGKYRAITYRETALKVHALASGLVATGVEKGDRIALISENRPEWAIADLAIMHIGAINVAMFPTLPAGQVQYIIADSEARIIIVSDVKQLRKALEVKKTLPDLHIVTMDCPADPVNDVMNFNDVLKRGETSPLRDLDYEERWKSLQPDDWASIIYTSGTTGDPKGAILSHGNFASNVDAAKDIMTFHRGDVLLSFVPLNHAMGRLVDHYLPLSCGSMIAYVENLRRLRQNLGEVKPHYMLLVPRVLEMFHEGLAGNIAKEPPWKQRLFSWAISVGLRSCEKKGAASPFLAFRWWLADKLVFSKIRDRLGLQRLKLFFSGGAPLPKAIAEFFSAMRLPILEGYGLTETSPLVAVTRPHSVKIGTVGPPVNGIEVRLDDDGEILVRGPNVMKGYFKKPEETAEAIDSEGWFHTGDIGEFDGDGFLKITDRKKNLLVLANGKKVTPQPIECRLLQSTYISQIILLGENRSAVTALIVPNFRSLGQWIKENSIGINPEDNREITQNHEVHRLIQDEIQRFSHDLADFERVHRFSLIDHEFTIENGELTPTLKVRRRVVREKYKDLIDAMYRSPDPESMGMGKGS
jgi:long-chain acyl-CoA synthetase